MATSTISPPTALPPSPVSPPPTLTLYTSPTPNGIKISITLAELSLPYTLRPISMPANEQKEPWFLEINPNGRIPALVDSTGRNEGEGKGVRVFESGSIMEYLVERYDPDHRISYPQGSDEAVEVRNWLFFQNAGVGPMQGQANHFARYAPERIPYATERYLNETRRLYRVLETHLSSPLPSSSPREYLVGTKATIADISHWGWVAGSRSLGIELDTEFPALAAWEKRMLSRPGVEAGRHVPSKHTAREAHLDKEGLERQAVEARGWVLEGMRRDAEASKKKVGGE